MVCDTPALHVRPQCMNIIGGIRGLAKKKLTYIEFSSTWLTVGHIYRGSSESQCILSDGECVNGETSGG